MQQKQHPHSFAGNGNCVRLHSIKATQGDKLPDVFCGREARLHCLCRLLCSFADALGCGGGCMSQLLTDLPEPPRCLLVIGRLAGRLWLAVTPVLGACAFHLRRGRQVYTGLGALLWRLEEDTGCLQKGDLPPWNGIWQQKSAQSILCCQQVTSAPATRQAVMCSGVL